MADDKPKPPRAPAYLGPKGRKFWKDATQGPTPVDRGFTFRVDELVVLERVCRTIDRIDEMEKEQATRPLITAGSMGQDAPSVLLNQIREYTTLLNQLLKSLGMTDAATEAAHRSVQARAAAQARWASGSKAS